MVARGGGGNPPPPVPPPLSHPLTPVEEPAIVSFHIPVATLQTDPRDALPVPDLRPLLVPRDSPLLPHNNWGGGFVDDEDRVALNTMHISSIASAGGVVGTVGLVTPLALGASDMCVDLVDSMLLRPAAQPTPPPPPSQQQQQPEQDFVHQGAWRPGGVAGGDADWLRPQTGLSSDGIEGGGGGSGTNGPVVAAPTTRRPAGEAAASSAAAATAAATGVSALAERLCELLPPWAVRAGPRRQIFFEPRTVNAAIVASGHVCPGINDVVQGVVQRLSEYGVPETSVLGILDGFDGFDTRVTQKPAFQLGDRRPRQLVLAEVEGAHLRGGSILGTSRGWADISSVVSKLEMWDINMLFIVGGDGGLRAGQIISEQCRARKLPCCVVGVPKSIENDILLVDRTFGFETAVQEVQRPLLAAKAPRRVDPWGKSWMRLRAANGQPSFYPPNLLDRAVSPSSTTAPSFAPCPTFAFPSSLEASVAASLWEADGGDELEAAVAAAVEAAAVEAVAAAGDEPEAVLAAAVAAAAAAGDEPEAVVAAAVAAAAAKAAAAAGNEPEAVAAAAAAAQAEAAALVAAAAEVAAAATSGSEASGDGGREGRG
ncbi:6-phosphofructokinase 5, chloroplastic [Tetrabaena socialis]|uniref:6-phosphofructokinase 5, chloroplastic n=1 Tax=Tetrabaena socialis TaxID=47790 RepID=A0A2J7ZUD4_9CHLO|nr:6-phosphofructokinase 5, chloroplastic [Tetrabaena socialis]|eukprot:PNH03885.1 6-phosphofructokinase 5, chloroplastic [Tetrabaena socialis]